MAKRRNKPKPWKNEPQESLVLLKKELQRRGMTDSEIESTLRKKRRRKVLEFNVVKSRHLMPHEINSPARKRKPPAAKPHDREPRHHASSELFTVHFAAQRLKLHPKTVLRFIREGRLRATRIGKSYRILRGDLEAFAGLPISTEPPAPEASVTSIIDVPGVGPELAQKWARTIPAVLYSRVGNGPHLHAEVMYEADRSHLKIVLLGAPDDMAKMISMIRTMIEHSRTTR
jgi:excisionase family DNA binding protein